MTATKDILAHKGQFLVDHLDQVGDLAASFATWFRGSDQACLAGILHDLGKAEEEFQKRLETDDKEGKKEPHAHHGAAYALDQKSWPIAFAVNGHHAGLHNRSNVDEIRLKYLAKAQACVQRLRERHPSWSIPAFKEHLPDWLQKLPFDARRESEGWFAVEVFTRFLFSALVDADSLNTEVNEKGIETSEAARKWPEFSPDALLGVLKVELKRRMSKAQSSKTASSEIQTVWSEVGSFCEQAGAQSPGLFSLTVPTGGGKTLASILFALAHAAHHNRERRDGRQRFRRTIVVIPYLSIIHQTAQELRQVFGDDMVLEHHSQADDREVKPFKKEPDDGAIDERARRRRLAAENWDAPIIVTTSVQFFGSLFSRRRSAARKLHNLCGSIVIFDEVQTLPPLMLRPILSILAELTHVDRPYGCSVVFCTATQPALGYSEDMSYGLQGVRSIIPQDSTSKHFNTLERVSYQWPSDGESFSWDQLAVKIIGNRERTDQQVLAIVNTRGAARELHEAIAAKLRNTNSDIPIDGLFHLSTWMIPSHRDVVLDEVRRRLINGGNQKRIRCILISTQCVEAGVDLDFPEVWRALGPYDSIVQAGGRCNRRGLLEKDGQRVNGVVHVFRPVDGQIPKGLYSTAISQTVLLRQIGRANPTDPTSFPDYFRLLYQLSVPDQCAIQQARAMLRFEQVNDLFKIIDDNTISVLILNQRMPDNNEDSPTPAKAIYEAARARGFFVREDWRRMQPYLINLLQSSHKPGTKFYDYLEPAFDPECGLYLWRGKYLAGLQGVGIDKFGPEDFII